jgi:hypothetical protein
LRDGGRGGAAGAEAIPMSAAIARRSLRMWAYFAVGVVGAIFLELLPTFAFGRLRAPLPFSTILVLSVSVAAAMAWMVTFAWLSFRNLDEFGQEGSKFAWYWGGTLGLAASAPVFMFIALGGLHVLWPASPLGRAVGRAFMTGYLLPTIAQGVGYGAVWIGWRAAKR